MNIHTARSCAFSSWPGGDRRGLRFRPCRERQLRSPAGLWQPSRPPDTVGGAVAAGMTLGNVALQIPLGLLSDHSERRRASSTARSPVYPRGGSPARRARPRPDLDPPLRLGRLRRRPLHRRARHVAQRFTGADLAASNSAFVFAYAAGALVGPAILGLGMNSRPAGFAIGLAAAFLPYMALVLARIAAARS